MQYLRNEILKHGLAVELAALLLSTAVLSLLLVDLVLAGTDSARMIRDVVAAVIFGTIVTLTALAVGEPEVRSSHRAPEEDF